MAKCCWQLLHLYGFAKPVFSGTGIAGEQQRAIADLFDVVADEVGNLLQPDDGSAGHGRFAHIADNAGAWFKEYLVFAVEAGEFFKVQAIGKLTGRGFKGGEFERFALGGHIFKTGEVTGRVGADESEFPAGVHGAGNKKGMLEAEESRVIGIEEFRQTDIVIAFPPGEAIGKGFQVFGITQGIELNPDKHTILVDRILVNPIIFTAQRQETAMFGCAGIADDRISGISSAGRVAGLADTGLRDR